MHVAFETAEAGPWVLNPACSLVLMEQAVASCRQRHVPGRIAGGREPAVSPWHVSLPQDSLLADGRQPSTFEASVDTSDRSLVRHVKIGHHQRRRV